MNFSAFNFAIVRPIRFLLAIAIAGLLILSSAFPAFAAKSQPTEGEANLNEIRQRSEQVAKDSPMSLKETQKKAQEGINEVQGAASKNKMISPEDTQEDNSVEQKVKKAVKAYTEN
ncbi:hypothetical protein [Oxynema aestuarii]|jgi:hypothetical protein|uniref:Low temperature-induced protein n=1 Tax=Oxynema aestuarii AP17 TaxID=2064643 RepID=A0A6H1U319_9CYAN|nr:hypothetical protein [Oxynema aestuarii]QIZ73234.1 hypothetical protein HCG48_23720 [Oxynema aestuarii AP17]RMH76094.1 MAG: hypothetical protein D6680_09485 [Cyanobacteria bacterium J007]